MLTTPQAATARRHLAEYVQKDIRFKKVFAAVKKDFVASGLTAHNWEHIYRDILHAIVIGEKEKTNMTIVLPAIALHDIGFLFGGTGRTHAALGADKLAEYLSKINVEYSSIEQSVIEQCIRTHKGSLHHEKPLSLEAKIVADADALDKFGPIGVYQCIRSMAEINREAERVYSKGDEMKQLVLETKTGQELAEQGRQYVVQFFADLKKAYKPYVA